MYDNDGYYENWYNANRASNQEYPKVIKVVRTNNSEELELNYNKN